MMLKEYFELTERSISNEVMNYHYCNHPQYLVYVDWKDCHFAQLMMVGILLHATVADVD